MRQVSETRELMNTQCFVFREEEDELCEGRNGKFHGVIEFSYGPLSQHRGGFPVFRGSSSLDVTSCNWKVRLVRTYPFGLERVDRDFTHTHAGSALQMRIISPPLRLIARNRRETNVSGLVQRENFFLRIVY